MVSPSHEEQSFSPSLRMDKQRSHMTERILRLTMEIIYLLTGEDYGPVKKCYGPLTPNNPPCGLEGWTRKRTPILEPLPPSLTPERNNDKKILEVTQKIIELLTGEVPIRCQDVTVYFSMEEWEYLEGHKELYKDIMMASQPALTSPGKREQLQLRTTSNKEGTTSDGSSNGNPPERCPRPLYSQDSTQEHQEIPREYQTNSLIIVKVEGKKDPYVMGDESCKEEDVPPEISTDGRDKEYKEKESSINPPVGQMKGYDLTALITMDLHPTFPSQHAPSTHRGHHPNVHQPPAHHMKPEVLKRFQCPDCGKRFPSRTKLMSHWTTHTGEKPYSCTECGRNFGQKSHLVSHQTLHTGKKPYSCPICGKCFSRQSHLNDHQRIHDGAKPYSCPVCGKAFSSKSNLLRHQKIHSGEKP